MKQYKLVNNIMGWLTFVIAAFVYCSTIEPTASFWDCPEFIVTGYKLEIGHPPGSPFFMLTANLFSQFVSDPSLVAKMVNTMSALLSATTILFLFWTITHLTRKLVLKNWDELTTAKLVAIEASGLVGALIYTFSDTFWFSAVEGEVYAYSSAFTAIVFWLILKWEDHADEPHSDRWLVLIAYMMGLSIGVHLLNLLCIPAIVLVYCYRRFPNVETKGSLLALLVSFVILAAVLYGVVPGIITVGGWFELFFVNTLGLSFNTGTIIYIVLLVASVVWAIFESYTAQSKTRENISFMLAFGLLGIPFYGFGWKAVVTGVVILALLWWLLNSKRTVEKKRQYVVSSRVKNTTLLCMLMLMIGYSSYTIVVIRSTSNPPMDQNSPEDIFSLGRYLSRDQYGYRPLLYGQTYASEYKMGEVNADGYATPKFTDGAPIYNRTEKRKPNEKDSYYVSGHNSQVEYEQNVFFPRMYSAQHASLYPGWVGGITGRQVPSVFHPGETITIPTAWENLKFFISYQCNFMYWRYFMWNFVGRQNDIKSDGELEHGNWLSGIKWLDNARLGDQSKLPDELQHNKGHNVFYGLPFLLGIIGLFWQAWRGRRGIRQFWVVFFLFFMTGLAIVIYLNQTPNQPRERDYAYAGSFYAYAIWCGIGVAAIIDLVKKYLKMSNVAVASVVSLLCLLVPIQMVSQTWDDHDRSNRYTCRDFGANYLRSLTGKNPIIFTNGDNDTFPLWYNQEVEGVGTDARVCNLSYLNTDWYIDQMKRPAYGSPALPISWPRYDYVEGTNDQLRVNTAMKQQVRELYNSDPEDAKKIFGDDPFELKNVMKYWVRNDFTPQQRELIQNVLGYSSDDIRNNLHCIPSDTLFMTIDKNAVKQSGMLMAVDSIPARMTISLSGHNYLGKSDLMMLEIISNSGWTRPVYVATTVGEDNFMNLGDNFIQQGLANRITPFNTRAENAQRFDADKTYDAVMYRFKYGNLSHPGLYIDETTMGMCWTHRRLLARTAIQLALNGEKQKAINVLNKAEKEIPEYNVPLNYISGGGDMAKAWQMVGNKQKARIYADKTWKVLCQYVEFYLQLQGNAFISEQQSCLPNFYYMQDVCNTYRMIDPKLYEGKMQQFVGYTQRYQAKGGQMPQQ
ncbi:MAG: protein O-mannosyl-transferase family [Prevotella sp.]